LSLSNENGKIFSKKWFFPGKSRGKIASGERWMMAKNEWQMGKEEGERRVSGGIGAVPRPNFGGTTGMAEVRRTR
jgi:hypothetical protein